MKTFFLRTFRILFCFVLIAQQTYPVSQAAQAAQSNPAGLPELPPAALIDSMNKSGPTPDQDRPYTPLAPKPTLVITPNHGYIGQKLTVSGVSPAGYTGIRVAWLAARATRTAGITSVDGLNRFSTEITIDEAMPVGTAQVCAAVMGTDLADFECAYVDIDPADVPVIDVTVPNCTPSDGEAAFQMIDQAGHEVADYPVGTDGVAHVTAPPYDFELALHGNSDDCPCVSQVVHLEHTIKGLLVSGFFDGYDQTIVYGSEDSDVVMDCRPVNAIVTEITADINNWSQSSGVFGTYRYCGTSCPFNDPDLPPQVVKFSAYLAVSGADNISGVEFYIEDLHGFKDVYVGTARYVQDNRYDLDVSVEALNLSSIWPSVNNVPSQVASFSLTAYPVVGVNSTSEEMTKEIRFVKDPDAAGLENVQDLKVNWNPLNSSYSVAGTIPHIDKFFPMEYDIDLGPMGTIENGLGAGVKYKITYNMEEQNIDTKIKIDSFKPFVQAMFMNKGVDKSIELVKPGTDIYLIPDPNGDISNYSLQFSPISVWQESWELANISGTIWSWWGIVSLKASLSVNVFGEVTIEGTITPLEPGVELTLTPTVGAEGVVSLYLDVLFGLVSAGFSGSANVAISLPLNVDIPGDPMVYFGDPAINAYLQFWGWIKAWFFGYHTWTTKKACVVLYGSCPPGDLPAQDITPESLPRDMPSPYIATDSSGRMLLVYVEDITPTEELATRKVMARFWDSVYQTWGPPMPITDGTHVVMEPTATFIGLNGRALAAWTETLMLPGEEAAINGDLAAYSARMEIFYSYFNGTTWSTPAQVTPVGDNLPDGKPDLSGDLGLSDAQAGATLAWTRNLPAGTDIADILTPANRRIAVTAWDPSKLAWEPFTVLDGSSIVPSAQAAAPAPAGGVEAPNQVTAVTFTVNSPLDKVDKNPGDGICATSDNICTLRAAIQESNALTGVSKTILLPPGTYPLAIAGKGEEKAATGDLDITDPVTIAAANPHSPNADPFTTPVIDGSGLDTVFDIKTGIAVTLTRLVIRGGNPGGIKNLGNLTLNQTGVIENLSATTAGGIFNNGVLTLNNSFVSNNEAAGHGGGIYSHAGVVTLTDSALLQNISGGRGAGLYVNSGTGSVQSSTLSKNKSGSDGGGIYNNTGTLVLNKSTLYGNNAGSNGGGLATAGQVTLTNVTVSGNHAVSRGGGIYVSGLSGRANINNITVTANTHELGTGGIHNAGGTVNLGNSILSDNKAGDCGGTLNSLGYNLVQDTMGCLLSGTLTGNLTGVSAKLAPLTHQPGSPSLHPLLTGSPALDAANPAFPGGGGGACEATDQRGVYRPQQITKMVCDIGAYEARPSEGGMNAQVEVTRLYDPRFGTRQVLVWVLDLDGNVNTNADRKLVVADYANGGWQMSIPDALPAGVESPAILPLQGNSNEYQVAFLVRGKDSDGLSDAGMITTHKQLWLATHHQDGTWTAGPVLDELGNPVYAEQPSFVISATSEKILVFRRFGAAGTTAEIGQVAMVQLNAGGQAAGAPVYLTDDANFRWQITAAINQTNGKLMVVDVNQASFTASKNRALKPAADLLPEGEKTALTTGGSLVEAITLVDGPDPALSPSLKLSKLHATSGSSIDVEVIVRNLGRKPATGLAVSFYNGTPPSGTLIKKINLPAGLGFNESYTLNTSLISNGSRQVIYAEVTSSSPDINLKNNIVQVDLGELPPPFKPSVSPSRIYPNALHLSWLPPQAEAIAGYRILRATSPGGPYELVGETTGANYTDVLLKRGQRYYYIVQAYDSSGFRTSTGVRSSFSPESAGMLPLLTTFLPVIRR